MENNNELLVKVDLLVSKIAELEEQINTLKNENIKVNNQLSAIDATLRKHSEEIVVLRCNN